jgi:hypothetical protein
VLKIRGRLLVMINADAAFVKSCVKLRGRQAKDTATRLSREVVADDLKAGRILCKISDIETQYKVRYNIQCRN